MEMLGKMVQDAGGQVLHLPLVSGRSAARAKRVGETMRTCVPQAVVGLVGGVGARSCSGGGWGCGRGPDSRRRRPSSWAVEVLAADHVGAGEAEVVEHLVVAREEEVDVDVGGGVEGDPDEAGALGAGEGREAVAGLVRCRRSCRNRRWRRGSPGGRSSRRGRGSGSRASCRRPHRRRWRRGGCTCSQRRGPRRQRRAP